MELRKDPITRSWVITGDGEQGRQQEAFCRYCPDAPQAPQIISSMPSVDGGHPWSARAVVHPTPIYRIEGEPQRTGEGLYDKMRTIGAHELLVENPRHDRQLWQASDAELEQFLTLAAQRIQDLKRDWRFKYVTISKNHGAIAGQEFEHPVSELTATTFVPRRVLYELRACKEYFTQKERCVFCDILAQESQQSMRVVEERGDFVAACPYAPRVPYEVWILPRSHEASFERTALVRGHSNRDLAALLRRTLTRIMSLTEDFHLVLHTSPNTMRRSNVLGYWKTIDEDYHWHIEILPIVGKKSRSYTFKEVYYSPVTSETAAQRLREAPAES
jgi:UDPglucose--hexose-1-phosphate uridylyltransferase